MMERRKCGERRKAHDISQLRDNYPRETAKATKGLEVRSSPLVKLST